MYYATTNDDSLKNSLAVSGGLHFLLFLFIIFGLPHLIPPLPPHHDPVPFQIVTLADLTNTRIKPDQEPPKPPTPQAEPKPTPPQPVQEQPKPQPAPPPPPPPQAQPEPPKPQPPAPKPPQPEEKPQAEALKPKPVVKPKPIEKPQQPQPDLASVLKNVAALKPTETPKTETKTELVKTQAPAPAVSSPAPSVATRLTISEEDALRRQIEQCWNFDPGARNAESMVVEVNIAVAPDKTVTGTPEIIDKARYNSDSFFRAAADAAVRALRNPRCSPLILPDGKYDEWKKIDFTFDPRDMM